MAQAGERLELRDVLFARGHRLGGAVAKQWDRNAREGEREPEREAEGQPALRLVRGRGGRSRIAAGRRMPWTDACSEQIANEESTEYAESQRNGPPPGAARSRRRRKATSPSRSLIILLLLRVHALFALAQCRTLAIPARHAFRPAERGRQQRGRVHALFALAQCRTLAIPARHPFQSAERGRQQRG